MLKDLRYSDFWHVEDRKRSLPTDEWGHYDHKADTHPYIITANGKRSKKYGRNQKDLVKQECKIRNWKDFGVYFNPIHYGVEEITAVYDSTGAYLADIQSLVFNYSWDELNRCSTIHSNQTRDCKVYGTQDDGGYLGFDIWVSNQSIEDFGYTAYPGKPHSTHLVYVYDPNAVLIAIYIADGGDETYSTVGEIDYVIQARNAILKTEIEANH